MKTVRKTYIENTISKNWMDKNLKPQEQSGFVRDAVADRIDRVKRKIVQLKNEK